MKKSLIWTAAGIATIGLAAPAFAAHRADDVGPAVSTPTTATVAATASTASPTSNTTSNSVESVTVNSVSDDPATHDSLDDNGVDATVNSVDDDSATVNSVSDDSVSDDPATHNLFDDHGNDDSANGGRHSGADDGSGHDQRRRLGTRRQRRLIVQPNVTSRARRQVVADPLRIWFARANPWSTRRRSRRRVFAESVATMALTWEEAVAAGQRAWIAVRDRSKTSAANAGSSMRRPICAACSILPATAATRSSSSTRTSAGRSTRCSPSIDALGAALVDRYGVAKGDRVAIGMRNYPEWVIVARWRSPRSARVVRVAQRLVDRGRDRLRARGLRRLAC